MRTSPGHLKGPKSVKNTKMTKFHEKTAKFSHFDLVEHLQVWDRLSISSSQSRSRITYKRGVFLKTAPPGPGEPLQVQSGPKNRKNDENRDFDPPDPKNRPQIPKMTPDLKNGTPQK